MAAKTLSGARGQLLITDPTTGVAKVVGTFSSVNWGLNYQVQDIHVLGRYSAAETLYTSADVVNISATGFRVVGAGAHQSATVPYLQNLMTHEYGELAIFDRQSNQLIAKMHSVRPTSYSTGLTARGVSEITVNFVGLLVDDESGTNSESVGASTLG